MTSLRVRSLTVRSAEFHRCCFAVFNRLRDSDSESLSMPLVREVMAELGSNLSAGAVYNQVRVWLSSVEVTRRLARQ